VNEYRAYIVGADGHFAGYRSFVCSDDADAMVWAKQLVDDHDVELWSGERFVKRLAVPASRGGGIVTHEVRKGRMIPKPAK
jgi:hypothetical protein